MKQFGEEFEPDFFDAITLRATIDCHDVIGGTATHRVLQAVQDAKERLTKLNPVELLDGNTTEADDALV